MGVKTDPTVRARRRRFVTATHVRAAAAFVGLAVGMLLFTRHVVQDPSFVDRVSIENPTRYDVRVEVATANGVDWMPLDVAVQRCTTSVGLVIDQGSAWRFRFSAQGQPGGELVVTRADLQRGDWTIRIPESVASELAGRAAPPPPQGCPTPAPR